mmetsp:Transcript_80506/g.231103  ORF Transcript_80506/g.231103 Transcript_80506/m.231103 type:complete len:235 (-) Transcript_80506:420-1124(-)
MDDVAPVNVPQSYQKLLGVRPNRLQRHPSILGVLFERYAEVVPHALEDQAHVPAVYEVPEQPNTVPLVSLVRLVYSLQDFHLLLCSLAHHVVAPHDFDGNLHLRLLVCGLRDIREDTLPALVLRDQIPIVHDLPNLGAVVPLRVIPIIRRCASLADGLTGFPLALQRLLICILIEHVVVMLRLVRQDKSHQVLLGLDSLLVDLGPRLHRMPLFAILLPAVVLVVLLAHASHRCV